MEFLDVFGDAARELFMYNRENFFFDGEIGIKQKFKSMDMRVEDFFLNFECRKNSNFDHF